MIVIEHTDNPAYLRDVITCGGDSIEYKVKAASYLSLEVLMDILKTVR